MECKKDLRRVENPMIAKLVYLEPELWNLLNRKAKDVNKTRSTFIRLTIKRLYPDLHKISGINWNEK